MKELRKPDSCPECGKKEIKRIVGGRPDEKGMELIRKGEAIPGNCFLKEWKEDWHCPSCSYQWCDKSDPVRVEQEELLRTILKKAKS